MAKIGIAIDVWKRGIFERDLAKDGYKFEVSPGLTSDTLTITVNTDDIFRIRQTVQRANDACAKSKLN